MSSVLARNRSLSELEFYKNACEMRGILTRFVMSEKHVPKKYRFVFAIPMTELLKELMCNITAANTIYPINEHEVQMRRDFQTMAIANCEQIFQMMEYMVDTLPIDANSLKQSIELTLKETALLKSWRKTNRVMQDKK
jgi:hypothetical protein